jgi:hypothetical protein
MTHELILTSVARGLDPKDRGFCPVAADVGITPRVFEHLAALSGYRYLIDDSGDLSQRSPVTYSHLILPGGLEHVLSRVAGIEADYQGQPNALAHHIVLEVMECPAESPAWLMSLPGFHFSEWNESPVRFARGRPVPTLTNPPSLTRRQQIARQYRWLDPQKTTLTIAVDLDTRVYLTTAKDNDEQITLAAPPTTPCPAWKELTGDPGWGGVLAETVFTGQSVVLIYDPTQNILPLFVETLALLPEFSAWRTTFSTYFTGLPAEIPCQWKGVIAGSEEAEQLASDPHCLVMNFTVPMGMAPEGKYVDFARHGFEHMLPLDMEEYVATIAAVNAETKTHSDDPLERTERLDTLSAPAPINMPSHIPSPPPPKIQLPQKQAGSLDSFLRRSSRFQFYFLYSIMFALVLFLLVLAVDQAGNFGIVQSLQNWNQQTVLVPPEMQEPEQWQGQNGIPELEAQAEADLGQIEQEIFAELEAPRKTFAEYRAEQREPLRQFLAIFDTPESLAINFPGVQDFQIDLPEKRTFAALHPLHDYWAALEIRFIPLFDLPWMRVETSPVVEFLPDLVWRTSAIDIDTDLATPMFHFQLTELGLEMDWQPEGLNTQYLYDTILSSLGFLQLSVADMPETAIEIPLFVPLEIAPMKVSDLANLSEQEPPEYLIELPFASELWQAIFATMNPSLTLRLEVRAEPEGNWVQIEMLSDSEFQAEVLTTQQAGRPMESGETVFEYIGILFSAEASLEGVVWKGDEYAERLRSEQEDLRFLKEELERRIWQLQNRIFSEGRDATLLEELEKHRAEVQTLNLRHGEIESILERLPAAYREISENASGYFYYSVFLESESTHRQLLILRTVP